MARILAVVEIRLVARNAGGRKAGKYIALVALRAIHHCAVRSCQRELRSRMVESRPLPARSGMALGAILWKSGRRVIGIVGVAEICQVARDARCRKARVHIALVALRAIHHCAMRTRQRELRGRMIEFRCLPACRRMAEGAILRKAGRGVVHGTRVVKIGEVARDAGGRHACVHAVLVALGTRQRGMSPGQWIARETVIEPGARP